jgi:predicted RNase H-like HicB family nuclease
MVFKNLSFTAVFIEDSLGGFSAYIEELPGVNTQGETMEEAREGLEEAFQLVLETNRILSQKSNSGKRIRERLIFA